MMKKSIALLVLMISYITYGQLYYRPVKPESIQSFQVPASSETGELAWFFPQRSFKQAKQFEKVEIGIKIPPSIDHKIQGFFRQQNEVREKINPFNRHDIDITAEFFVNGNKVKTIDAFYYEEFRRNLALDTWLSDTTSYPFRVRYSPEVAGIHTLKITIDAKGVARTTTEMEFEVVESEHKGFLEKGTHGRHMRHSKTKETFFGVGHVLPWAEWDGWLEMDKGAGPVKFMILYNSMRKLNRSGGNFTRFVAAPWFMQLEWEALGNYRPKLNHAWEFDRMNDQCDEYGMYYMFCPLLHAPLEKRTDEQNGSHLPGVRWESYCYNDNDLTPADIAHEEPIGATEPIDFYRNEDALDHQKNYFRYCVSRWGYSTSLMGWQLMSEVDQTCDYRDEQLEDGTIIDRSDQRASVTKWTDDISKFMKNECNDQHPKSISFIVGKNYSSYLWDPEIYKLSEMEFVGLHDYVFEVEPPTKRIRNRNLIKRFETVRNLGAGTQDGEIKHPEFQNRMFIYDEFGHNIEIPRKWPEDRDIDPVVEFNHCTGFIMKQDLWFTVASGCAVAGLNWWNDKYPERHKQWKEYFPGIVEFTKDIDFENVNYTELKEKRGEYYIAQRWPLTRKDIERSNTKDYRKSDMLEAYIQVSDDGAQGFGWMMNRSHHWMNMKDSLPCLKAMFEGTEPYSKRYLYEPADNDLTSEPLSMDEGTAFIRVYNVKKRAEYTVDFYDTMTGEIIQSVDMKSSFGGTLKVWNIDMQYGEREDVAFKFYEKGTEWK